MEIEFKTRHVLECTEIRLPFPVIRYATREVYMWGNPDRYDLQIVSQNLTTIDQTLLSSIKWALNIKWLHNTQVSRRTVTDFHYFATSPNNRTNGTVNPIQSQYTTLSPSGKFMDPNEKESQEYLAKALSIETRIQSEIGERSLRKWPLELDRATHLFDHIRRGN